jgi:methylenetetrahydrofolate dehydrogenase (NADP+)/methenyltetrahydrofolate cyclohydrolase
MLINGNEIAEKILRELRKRSVPEKELAAILVGDDSASLSFLRKKAETAQLLNVKFKLYRFADSLSQFDLEKKVREIYDRSDVGGVIVQLPLPAKYDRIGVLNCIGIDKDIDVLNGETSKVLAPAAASLERILAEIKFDPADKNVVVVGSGLLIGRPIANWLMSKAKQVVVINRGGYDSALIRCADLVISGTGVPRLIKGQDVKHGAVIVDYGYGRDEADELAGDVDLKSVSKVAGWVTPTPGGTGPVVVAMLFSNFYKLQ